MNKAVMVFGSEGRIGVPTCQYLHKLGYKVYRVDKEFTHGIQGQYLFHTHTDDYRYYMETYGPDLVISCMPYTENFAVASEAMRQGIDYCDLGGKVENTDRINALYHLKKYKSRVFTDLGLAPGLINIVTQELLSQFTANEVKRITCMVGGIPVKDVDPPFNYHCTWSIEGLLNEYYDDCKFVAENYVSTACGLSGVIGFKSVLLDKDMEAFMTSGATATSLQYAVQNHFHTFAYKTIRYPGHASFMKDLRMLPLNIRKRIVQGLSDSAPVKTDLVLGAVILEDHQGCKILQHEFKIDSTDQLTAMQIATAAPLVSVAHMMLRGDLPSRYLVYEDVVDKYNVFTDILNVLGVDLNKNSIAVGIYDIDKVHTNANKPTSTY